MTWRIWICGNAKCGYRGSSQHEKLLCCPRCGSNVKQETPRPKPAGDNN